MFSAAPVSSGSPWEMHPAGALRGLATAEATEFLLLFGAGDGLLCFALAAGVTFFLAVALASPGC